MRTRKHRKRGLVRYGSTVVKHQGLTRQQTEMRPEIMFVPQIGKQYTLLMYDLDAPNPAYVHWLAANITNPRNYVSQIVYMPPNPPPTNTHYHRYMFELLEQPGPIDVPVERAGFQVQTFKKKYGLQTVASTGFYVMP